MTKKIIAICIPLFNEESNLEDLYKRICKTIDKLINYQFCIIFADNDSKDGSLEIIKKLSRSDKRVGFIKNISNFGFVRSSANVLLAPDADANIFLMADLQDPPELIEDLIYAWESRESSVVFATRKSSKENTILFLFKKIYYALLSWLADYKMVRDTTGFGIYDRSVIKSLRKSVDSYPFIKGLVCATGFKWTSIPYKSSERSKGRSSASLSFLIDFGILGIVTLSRKPMRIITYSGVGLGFFSILLSLIVIITKIVVWNKFAFGLAMLSVTLLFLTGSLLAALGIIGEYIGFINQRSLNLPLVVEEERKNIPQIE